MPKDKNTPEPAASSPTSQMLADAAPPAPPAPAATTEEHAPSPQPPVRAADPFDGFIHLRLSPEGTQTGPERRKAGETRGPNITLPLRRLSLRLDATDEDVIRAVAGYLNMPFESFDDCAIVRSDNKMHAIEVHRPWPGEDEPRLGARHKEPGESAKAT